MKPRDRMLGAIRHEPADRIATDAIHIENQPEIARYLGIEPDQVLDRLGIDGRIVAAPYTGERPAGAPGESLTEWGTPDTGDYGTARLNPLAGAGSARDVERYAWPDPADYDYAAAAQAARTLNDTYAVRGPYWQPLFCRVCDLFGMEEAMVRLATEPAVFEAAIERVFAFTHAYCARLLDACDDALPILCLGDDFATQRGMMISPEMWRRFLKPRFARLFELGKRRGKFVWFHSCGDVTAILPDLIEIGVDVWETVQLHTLPLTAEQLKRNYGRHLTFFGGVNTQRLPFATPEAVRAETLRCIEALGEGGGYICGPDHHIKPDVPPANTVALFDTAHAFRRGGYTL
jgi:uroporphyrinogen decarboxylase